jgi:hypothetical protein
MGAGAIPAFTKFYFGKDQPKDGVFCPKGGEKRVRESSDRFM